MPRLTFVGIQDSIVLGSPFELQSPSIDQPGVEVLPLHVVVRGNVTVPSGGFTSECQIQVDRSTASITGSDTLTLEAELSGTGSVGVPVVNTPLGSVIVIADALDFGDRITNQTGAAITVVNGSIAFPGDGFANDDGLVNEGTLNLVDCVVDGDVRSPAGSIINVAGTVVFNGLVSGAGTFSGTTNLVTFNGGYSPGD